MEHKVSYMGLLKEAISEFDTSNNVDVKGPFLDPILGYDGGGELPTHKDAASILERYYFKETQDKGVTIEEDASIPQVGKDKAALPEEPESVDASKKDTALAAAQKDDGNPDEGTIAPAKLEDMAFDMELDEPLVEDDESIIEAADEQSDLSETEIMENAVIEKLIAEMEEEILDEETVNADFTKDEDNTQAAGTEERDDRALTPPFKAGQVPDRKDDVSVDESEDLDDASFLYEEEDIVPGGEEKPLDVDAELKEALGPDLRSSAHDPEDMGDRQGIEEAFAIFKEEIEEQEIPVDDDAPKLNSRDIRV